MSIAHTVSQVRAVFGTQEALKNVSVDVLTGGQQAPQLYLLLDSRS